MSNFVFIDLPNMYHLFGGLSLNTKRCAAVLDAVLVDLNKKTGIPDQIVKWNRLTVTKRSPLAIKTNGNLIFEMTELYKQTGTVSQVALREIEEGIRRPPGLHILMHSPTLDIPMRVEIPLRLLLKGCRKLRGTHWLLTNDRNEYVYYGQTRRSWNLRFMEHFKDGSHSKRLFPTKFFHLVDARIEGLHSGGEQKCQSLRGLISAICVAGLNSDEANDVEEYLIDKYSLSSKHQNGLNMIPGGLEGIRSLGKLSLRKDMDTEEREEVLNSYLKEHSNLGVPNPAIAECWQDPEYAEAVICGRENRLSGEQVRKIRYLAALGNSPDLIKEQVDALNVIQIIKVLEGRTYSRIQ